MDLGVLIAFLGVAILAALDLVADLGQGTTIWHVALEGTVVLVALAGAAVMARRLARAVREARAARAEVKVLAERLEGLGATLDRQFESWALSPAEKEVALLLLKGLSHKEIADLRAVSEATARQQARSVYRKAGVSGRSDLAAFFLEDLLVPAVDR